MSPNKPNATRTHSMWRMCCLSCAEAHDSVGYRGDANAAGVRATLLRSAYRTGSGTRMTSPKGKYPDRPAMQGLEVPKNVTYPSWPEAGFRDASPLHPSE